jgi:hypothetical protein
LAYDHAMAGDDRARGGEGRDEGSLIGEDGSVDEAETSKGGQAERSQTAVLETWFT